MRLKIVFVVDKFNYNEFFPLRYSLIPFRQLSIFPNVFCTPYRWDGWRLYIFNSTPAILQTSLPIPKPNHSDVQQAIVNNSVVISGSRDDGGKLIGRKGEQRRRHHQRDEWMGIEKFTVERY